MGSRLGGKAGVNTLPFKNCRRTDRALSLNWANFYHGEAGILCTPLSLLSLYRPAGGHLLLTEKSNQKESIHHATIFPRVYQGDTGRVAREGYIKFPLRRDKSSPKLSIARLATGPRYNVGDNVAPLVENRISGFRIRKFKILNAKRWMEPEIAIWLKASLEKSIRTEPDIFRSEPEIALWPKPSLRKCMRPQPEIAFCIVLPSNSGSAYNPTSDLA